MVRGATDQEGRGAKEGTEASTLDPPSVPVSCFHRQNIQFSEQYSSSSSRDLFAVGIAVICAGITFSNPSVA